MDNKQMKMCSISRVIRELEVKAMIEYYSHHQK
jgi:hypothetical protein